MIQFNLSHGRVDKVCRCVMSVYRTRHFSLYLMFDKCDLFNRVFGFNIIIKLEIHEIQEY